MANKWLMHVKKTMKTMKSKGTYVKGKGLGQVIKEAKKTWHKGGELPVDTDMSAGKRRRKTVRRSRKH